MERGTSISLTAPVRVPVCFGRVEWPVGDVLGAQFGNPLDGHESPLSGRTDGRRGFGQGLEEEEKVCEKGVDI